jgi:hypothetical protein
MSKRSGIYAIYKGKGCAKFSQLPPRFKQQGEVSFVDKNGAILLEVAPGNGDRNNPQWFWDQKITFAIGIPDVCALLEKGGEKRLFHDHGGTPKVLQFTPGEGKYEGTWMMNISQGKGSDRKSISVPFSGGEWAVLLRLLVGSVPMMLNWK